MIFKGELNKKTGNTGYSGEKTMEQPYQQALTHMQKRKLVFFVNNKAANLMGARHWHVVYEILFVRRGEGTLWINTQQMQFAPGDLVFIRPGDVHTTRADSPDGYRIDVLQFLPDLVDGIAQIASSIIRGAPEEVKAIFDAFGREAQREDEGQMLTMLGLTHLLGGWILRRQGSTAGNTLSPLIRSIHAYLDTAESLRLQDTAAHFGYSPEHLSRRFHAETGISYRQWCDTIRLRRASALLREGTEHIADIAGRLGYSDESGFIRAFRRAYGITPYAYRKSHLPLDAEKRTMQA